VCLATICFLFLRSCCGFDRDVLQMPFPSRAFACATFCFSSTAQEYWDGRDGGGLLAFPLLRLSLRDSGLSQYVCHDSVPLTKIIGGNPLKYLFCPRRSRYSLVDQSMVNIEDSANAYYSISFNCVPESVSVTFLGFGALPVSRIHLNIWSGLLRGGALAESSMELSNGRIKTSKRSTSLN
jgi:hypothetical protein